MIQKDKMTYAEYHEAVGHHDRRSEKIQRDEIERCIATLYKEADWWTLNLRHANLEALKWTSNCLTAILQSQREQQTK